MGFTVAAFEAAVRAHVSPVLANRLRPVAQVVLGSDADDAELDHDAAGRIILASLLGSEAEQALADADALRLTAADLSTPTATVTLSAADTARHPLLSDWSPPSLAEAIGQIIEAGKSLTAIGPGGPLFLSINLSIAYGVEPHAEAHMTFPGAQVGCSAALIYGTRPVSALPLESLTRFHGDGLFNVGVNLQATPLGEALRTAAAVQEASVAVVH